MESNINAQMTLKERLEEQEMLSKIYTDEDDLKLIRIAYKKIRELIRQEQREKSNGI